MNYFEGDSLPDPQSIPEDVRRAAETVRVWAESQDLKYWQLGGVCDRRFAYRRVVERTMSDYRGSNREETLLTDNLYNQLKDE